ncbi:protein SINE1-like [Impatiens glandulifera]|uniref:protein SINE1-like n=1 Tax=Impatiens glandulifera TaxID=253017 RepID=UPI001FB0C007|nr:protein SINE1-like [Impatiens glandulifera]
MRRSLSPILRRELENLDKDADSRRSAMKALKLYVKDLDSKAIPFFLAKVSETKGTGSSTGEYTISLYEVLARVHGPKIVPQIDNIMTTIVKTLTSSAGSFALHQACSKVVPAIARYGIDPTTPEEKKRFIIHSLCKPLSDSLLGNQESLSSGSALCLKALVESDNWRFASAEMVNEVCQRLAGALEKPAQTNSHMGLVMALAKHNCLIVEAYARLLIQSGLKILKAGVTEGNSQKRLSSIQMMNFLLKCLDPKSTFSELDVIIEEMENCQSDQMAYVRGSAFETLQTARRIANDKGLKLEKDTSGSSSSCMSNNSSPESQTMDSFTAYGPLTESPLSPDQVSWELNCNRRLVNRKLWKHENGGVDVSLEDGLYSGEVNECYNDNCNYGDDGVGNGEIEQCDGFSGFNNLTPSQSKKANSQISMDNVKIFTTPRKLIRSLQDDTNDNNFDFSENNGRRFTSPCSRKFDWTPASKYEAANEFCEGSNMKNNESPFLNEPFHQFASESVSSTEDVLPIAAYNHNNFHVVSQEETTPLTIKVNAGNQRRKFKSVTVICAVFVALCALVASFLIIDDQDVSLHLVPT